MSEADPVLRLLGLAARAGAILPGTERVRHAAGAGPVPFVIVAGDASANSRDKLVPLLRARGVEHVIAFDRDRLGAAVGKAPLSAVAVTSVPLARQLQGLLSGRTDGRG
jgi:ribosomal protein L7Ae-like RNA K-turn-binding protein